MSPKVLIKMRKNQTHLNTSKQDNILKILDPLTPTFSQTNNFKLMIIASADDYSAQKTFGLVLNHGL